MHLWIQCGLIWVSRAQHLFDSSPELFAVFHALLRLLTPRHPPCALSSLTTNIQPSLPPVAGLAAATRRRFGCISCLPRPAPPHLARQGDEPCYWDRPICNDIALSSSQTPVPKDAVWHGANLRVVKNERDHRAGSARIQSGKIQIG